ncbi:fumarylacetoacetate (FAA) hydrolase [Sphingobium chlorophenolicum L-1]|uniref:Fumarylacetoacetate (FAA) hydrolase n=1 Tax=Sphingobium chlorophenolicum L-1 TaxID=690566 RepID=F6F1T1_SPHCR|nr:fumarylacetoacetate (FAA) hydrolase [Sphingobium chlorophenolicum L-1]
MNHIILVRSGRPPFVRLACYRCHLRLLRRQVRQQSNTRHLIFDPVAQVEHLSQAMTLETGDILFTGTPGGVGAAMSPPKFLAPGDRVRVEIDGIGFIENEVIDEPGR